MLRRSFRIFNSRINFLVQSSKAFSTDNVDKTDALKKLEEPGLNKNVLSSGFSFESVEKDAMSSLNTENAEKLIVNTIPLLHDKLSLSQGLYIGRIFARYPDKVGREPIEKLLKSFFLCLNELESNQYVELVWILAKLYSKANEKLTKDILTHLEPQINDFSLDVTPSCTALFIWGFGKTQNGTLKFWQGQIELFSKSINQMKTIDIANAAWGLTKAEDYFKFPSDKKLWMLLADFLKKKIDTINDLHAFSNILWVFSRKELGHEEFWERAIKQTNKNLENFETQALSNSVWAITKTCSIHYQNLLEKLRWDKVEDIFLKRHLSYKETELCSLAWSFSKARSGSKQLWNLFYSKLKTVLTNNKVEDLAITTITASMATLSNLKLTDDEMWDRILEIIKNKKRDIGKKDLVTICLALAVRKKGDEDLWSMFEEIILSIDPKVCEPKFISNIAWCFSLRGLGSQKFWDFIKTLIQDKLTSFTPQGISTCFWAFAKSKVSLEMAFIDTLLSESVTQLMKFNSTDLAMLLWSLGRLPTLEYQNNSNIENLLNFAEGFLITNKEKLSDIDTAHSLLGFYKLKGGSSNFWEIMEAIVRKKLDTFNEEGLSVVLHLAVEKFSSNFWTHALSVAKKRLKSSSAQGLKNFINSFGYLKEENFLISTQFWIALEEDLFIKMDTLSPLEISDIGIQIAKHQKGTADLWRKFENYFIAFSKNFNINEKQNRYVILNVLKCTMKSNMLTPSLNVIFLPFCQFCLEKTFCTTNDVFIISCSYGKAKISDDKLWFQMEKKVSQIRKRIDFYKLIEILKNFSFLKKGTERFWKESISYLEASKENLSLTQTCQIYGHFNQDIDLQKWGQFVLEKLEKEKNPSSFLKTLNELAFNKKYSSLLKFINLDTIKDSWKTFPNEDKSNLEKEYRECLEMLKKQD